ncbi:copper transporter 1-like [Solanum dulcamara]|uniref:copper transporter 1-like n=1 Tax=Solanum dulcamara TaxID=45834 RepID=UPI0024866B5C|nr:copper transporter 1-like [Solanum dulcamara]
MSHTYDHQGNMDMPHDQDMPMIMNMVMKMNFYWGKDVTILFKGWPDNNLGMYILSLFFVFFMAFGVEIMSMGPIMISKRPIAAVGFIQAGIYYTVRMVLVYFVMLAVMSFNIGIFIVAILGHGLGYVFVKFRELETAETTMDSNVTDPKV